MKDTCPLCKRQRDECSCDAAFEEQMKQLSADNPQVLKLDMPPDPRSTQTFKEYVRTVAEADLRIQITGAMLEALSSMDFEGETHNKILDTVNSLLRVAAAAEIPQCLIESMCFLKELELEAETVLTSVESRDADAEASEDEDGI